MTPAPKEHRLSGHHREQLITGSSIPANIVRQRGYWTATSRAELKRLGFADLQCNAPALVIPLRNAMGDVSNYQIRPDTPRIKNGKLLKYESPAGSHPTIDVPLCVRAQLGDPRVRLWITEGSKKADAAAARDLCCVALLGVWGWRGTNELGGMTALADWELIALKGREVVLAFDSDVMVKAQVLLALRRLTAFVKFRGATVRICLLPSAGGKKVGLDDFFVAGGTVEQLEQHLTDELPTGPHDEDNNRVGDYSRQPSAITWFKETRDGEIEVFLTNFDAQIITDITRDDGALVTREFEIEAVMENGSFQFSVQAKDFNALDWVAQHLGARALVNPAPGARARTPHAIQSLSRPLSRTIYAHTGWRLINGVWCFLHGGGALGPDGPLADVEVTLSTQISACVLGTDDHQTAAVKTVLRFLDVAPRRVTWPLLIAAFRAALGDCDLSVFLEGLTGTRKTALAALAQQFFGCAFDADHLPGNWTSTANAREELLFECKDIICVLDDFVAAPGMDRSRLDAAADRALRNVANRAARQRMRSDGSMRPARPPRALVIVTGEFLPAGHSLRARMIVIELKPGDVRLEQLTVLQRAAAEGQFSCAMSAFIQWLASRLAEHQDAFRARASQVRDALQGRDWHGRTVNNVGQLIAAGELMLRFARDVGAIDESAYTTMCSECIEVLTSLGDAQQQHLQDADPVDQFFSLLRNALAGGRAHLRALDSQLPPPGLEQRCGWVRDAANWSSRGQLIGYVDNESVYLLPDLVESVVMELGRQRGEQLQLAGSALRRRLNDRGKLAAIERRGGKERLLCRISVDHTRHDVLHLHLADVLPSDQGVAQVAQSDATDDEATATAGPRAAAEWPVVAQGEDESGPGDAHAGPPGPPPSSGVAQRKSAPDNKVEQTGPFGPLPAGTGAPQPGPAMTCRLCKTSTFWCTASGPWSCTRCHPPVDGRAAWLWDSRTLVSTPWMSTPTSQEES